MARAAKYGEMAIYSVRLIVDKNVNPVDAWTRSGEMYYPNQESSRSKGCPKAAFLGLCESGKIKGVPSGKYLNADNKNKSHIIQLLSYLKKTKSDLHLRSKKKIWENAGFKIKHNNQVDILLALYKENLIDI